MTRWYAAVELVVFLLLIANTVVFVVRGSAAEGLDAVAWLTLILLLAFEAACAGRLAARRALAAVRVVRWAAGAAVVVAALGYVQERAWLDAANAWLWIAVVVLLEAKVRLAAALRRPLPFTGSVTAALYAGLAELVLVWAWRGEWFDAYDAALWIVAFATIEVNLARRLAAR